MSRVNLPANPQTNLTHEGAPAYVIDAERELRRSVMSCLLWEDEFYESGKTISERIKSLVPLVSPERVSAIAMEARNRMHLRHVPLLLTREMARHKSHRAYVRVTLSAVIQRADELAEFLAVYWKDGKQPLAKSVQRGLADAFKKFNAYQLAKYNRDNAVKLRDVLFLSHAKPERVGDVQSIGAVDRKGYKRGVVARDDEGQGLIWQQLVKGELATPDTWEVAISAAKGDEKNAVWARLLSERKLGAMALLRNLRNLQKAGIPDADIAAALREMDSERVLPFRFLAALRFAPQFVGELDAALIKNLSAETRKLPGSTAVLVDVSGSMDAPLSAKSDMQRIDAAAGLAVLARELCERVRVFSFSDHVVEVPAFRGLALAKAITASQAHNGTLLGQAVKSVKGYDRLIVISDEQSHDRVPPPSGIGYMINVASAKNGVSYGPWRHVDGWSDRVLDYIRETEAE